MAGFGDPTERKNVARRQALDARNSQPEKDRVSRAAIDRFIRLPEFAAAQTVMWYVDCRSELRTRHAIPAALSKGQRVVVPFCTVDDRGVKELGLWHLEALDELVVGQWQIMEPPRNRWNDPGKRLRPEAIDLVMVPGVAFSRDGSRLGNGYGYYDRLLKYTRSNCSAIGICYECQLIDGLAVEPHDISMDKVVTQAAVYG